ncbi:MAG TPA: hypothetical protein VF389_01325 [Woeseiaceae bacterium]
MAGGGGGDEGGVKRMKDIHARTPVDRVAARVVCARGEYFTPNKQVLTNDSEMPLATRPVPANTEDLTGRRFGRFVVLGLSRDLTGRWVVRCSCGRCSMRRSRAVTNPENGQDRCEHCRHLAFLKREERWRRTGRDADIRDY